MACGLFSGE